MIKAVLLDLDNTLLHNPDRQFAQAFMQQLESHLRQSTNTEKVASFFRQGIKSLTSDRDMMRTNTELIAETIANATPMSIDQVYNILQSFYDTEYHNLQSYTSPVANSRQLIEQLLEQNLDVAIATNPIYPQTAILERLEWAGLSSFIDNFAFITHSDNMHFSKPHPAYYAEVVARIGIEPDEAIMVGDGLRNDIEPAKTLGIHTFHITKDSPLDNFIDHIHTENWQHQHPLQPLTPDAIIPQYQGNIGALYGLLAEVKGNQWVQRPDPNEWSIKQILYHLQYSETSVQRHRIHKILGEENPFIASQPPPGPNLETDNHDGFYFANQFRLERIATIKLLSQLSPNQWQLPARHSIFGLTTLLEMAYFTAQHDRLHISQLCQTLGNCN